MPRHRGSVIKRIRVLGRDRVVWQRQVGLVPHLSRSSKRCSLTRPLSDRRSMSAAQPPTNDRIVLKLSAQFRIVVNRIKPFSKTSALLPQSVRTNGDTRDHICGHRWAPNPPIDCPGENRKPSGNRDRNDSGSSMPRRRSRINKARVHQQTDEHRQK